MKNKQRQSYDLLGSHSAVYAFVNNFIYNFEQFKYSYSLCMSILGILILVVELYSY